MNNGYKDKEKLQEGSNCRGAWRKALSDLWLIARFSFQISLYSVVND